ncbi:metalloregulator ArsR/SmtB family transcription factor [Micromonospora sp. WMMD710]|uniref:ArsR/SmtB family transcription factor n=1 Tax=Micromonospora sp. WMMD710 TaxID=3016085 RepID=UPI002417B87A|nr:metalloregulator ArsR/SmtB family transcription factor [Micromonospora sp. WMMD710]MDG4758139.1 metalloregulator ArsR/SmtB family transcription factor [Micromonospora sp. WMMD710]
MDEVATAIADPVRRHILTLLHDEPLSAGDIAQRFTISRPAISRHLRVLRESGLVRDEVIGRQRIYRLDVGPLAPLLDWLTGLVATDRWGRHLDALETEVYRTRRERRARGPAEHRREHTA